MRAAASASLGCRHPLWRESFTLLFVLYIAQRCVRGWIEVYTVRAASLLCPRGEDHNPVVHIQVRPWEREKLGPAQSSLFS